MFILPQNKLKMKSKKIMKTIWKAMVVVIALSMVLSMVAIGF